MDVLKYELPDDDEERIDLLEEIIEELEGLLEDARWNFRYATEEDDLEI